MSRRQPPPARESRRATAIPKIASTTPDLVEADARRPISGTLATLLGTAAFCIVIAGAQSIGSILGPIALAAILVITFFPVTTWLTARRVPSWAATGVTILALFLVLSAITASLGLAAAQLVNTLPDYQAEFTQLYQQSIELLTKYGVSEKQITTALRNVDPQSVVGYAQTLLASLQGLGGLISVLLVTVLFIALDATDMPRRLDHMSRTQPDIVNALHQYAFSVRKYWLVSSVFGLAVAIIDVAALYWLGVPMAITFGVLAFVTNYIPNVGFLIGLVPPALMALLDGGVSTAVWVVVAYCVINFVIQTLIQPRFTGDAVGLSASLTFISLLFWAWVLGALGALLAVPLTLFFKAVFIDRDPRARWLNTFISNTGQ